MQNTNLFTREDTFFGVCQGLGEDLGIPPVFLRLALAGLLFWNPWAAAAAYLTGGAVVLFARLLYPVPRTAEAAEPDVAEPAAEGALEPEPEAEAEPVPLAA